MMACYCRVSTRRQKTDSQKADIQRWLTSHAVSPAVVQWFEDMDSGTTLSRSAFDRMQQEIFLGTITTVVVWKLDRISRRQREGVNLLAEWCERRVRIVVITQQLDLSGAVGRLVAKRKGRYHGRAQGTTKAQPTRVRLLYDRGFTVVEIMQALQVSRRTVYRYLAAEEKA